MTYGGYLKDHGIWAGLYLFLLASLEIFLVTMSGGTFLMVCVFALLTGSFFLGTYVEYRKVKGYFDELWQSMEVLREKHLFYEMIEREQTQEEKQVKELFYDVERDTVAMSEEFKRESREYREFVETWVHEIKIPIAVMKMILANHKEADLGISGELERVEKYVDQALFYARSSAAEKDYLIGRIGLQKTVQAVILSHKRQLREINARIDLHDLDPEVFSDGKWLQFMIGQVVDNSIKYRSPEGNLVLEVYATKSPNAVQLHVKDNGIGIKTSEVGRVFDKGFTGKNGRLGANSTGIGLYLCKNLCEKLEHGIEVRSGEGEGTEVIFVFPMSAMTEAAE